MLADCRLLGYIPEPEWHQPAVRVHWPCFSRIADVSCSCPFRELETGIGTVARLFDTPTHFIQTIITSLIHLAATNNKLAGIFADDSADDFQSRTRTMRVVVVGGGVAAVACAEQLLWEGSVRGVDVEVTLLSASDVVKVATDLIHVSVMMMMMMTALSY